MALDRQFQLAQGFDRLTEIRAVAQGTVDFGQQAGPGGLQNTLEDDPDMATGTSGRFSKIGRWLKENF